MSELEIEASVANLGAAQTFYNLFVMNFYERGWMPAIHGSVIANGRGRDLDIIMVKIGSDNPLTEDDVKNWLVERMGFDLKIDEDRWSRMRGLVGVMHTYIIDITLVR